MVTAHEDASVLLQHLGASENDILAYLDPVYGGCIHQVLVSSPFATQRIADMFNKRAGIGPEATTQPHIEVNDSIVGWLPDSPSGCLFDSMMDAPSNSVAKWLVLCGLQPPPLMGFSSRC